MKKIFSKTAYTLMELIIALMLVGIILLGIVSINLVLNSNGIDYGQRYLVKSSTQTTLNHILNDASQAIGSATTVGSPPVADQAIVFPPGALSNLNFCFHQQPTGPGSDRWACYEWDGTAADSTYRQIWTCNLAYNVNSGTLYRGADAANCAGSGTFVGTAFSISSPAVPTFYIPINQFVITIENCLNDTAASCYNANPALQDPVNNPQVKITGTVAPTAVGSN